MIVKSNQAHDTYIFFFHLTFFVHAGNDLEYDEHLFKFMV